MDIAASVVTSRLVAQQRAMDVTAGNLANMNTPGFRTTRVQFSDWISRQRGAATPPGAQTVAYTQDRATWRDSRPGGLRHSGNPFDLALTGDGFFTVNTPAGPRLTRDGRFTPLADGTIADHAGNALLDTTGRPIQIVQADTRVTIAGDGTISSENGQLGRIGIVRPEDAMRLKAEGSTLLLAESATTQVDAPGLVQGAVEDSNVQPVLEVTRMINEQRTFEFAARFVQSEADRQQAAIDKILSPNR